MAMKNGTIKHNKEGITKVCTSPPTDTLLAIHNMVVVTSPIGDQAPPAFAAITTKPANHKRSFLLDINFRNSVIKTMVAVRLSMIADKIKANTPMIQSNFFLLRVRTAVFKTSNPLWRSMISTIVMAPIRKTKISAVLPR